MLMLNISWLIQTELERDRDREQYHVKLFTVQLGSLAEITVSSLISWPGKNGLAKFSVLFKFPYKLQCQGST